MPRTDPPADSRAQAAPADTRAAQPAGTGAPVLLRAAPSLVLIAAVSLAPLWGVLAQDWSVLAVAFLYVADGAADGLFVWLRARQARGGGDEAGKDRVLVSEFVKTYFVVVFAMLLILYMVFSGRLLKPGGEAPTDVYAAFFEWQFWALIAAFAAVRAFTYWWDWVRGDEAAFMPPAAVVAVPLRRLFLLQFLVLAGGVLVYWALDSSTAGLAVLVALIAAAQLLLAVWERLRTARIRAAVDAGVPVVRPAGAAGAAPKQRPRGGRKRRRGR
jgi:hypothetical protein